MNSLVEQVEQPNGLSKQTEFYTALVVWKDSQDHAADCSGQSEKG